MPLKINKPQLYDGLSVCLIIFLARLTLLSRFQAAITFVFIIFTKIHENTATELTNTNIFLASEVNDFITIS